MMINGSGSGSAALEFRLRGTHCGYFFVLGNGGGYYSLLCFFVCWEGGREGEGLIILIKEIERKGED